MTSNPTSASDGTGPADAAVPAPAEPVEEAGAAAAPSDAALPADIAELSYEQARDQLVEVVQRLENGTADLEESIRLWERGEALAVRCRQWLDGARERLDRVTEA
jgi:exodeoxyribonuclease VII small subunit